MNAKLFAHELKSHGLRITGARLKLLNLLRTAEEALSASAIHDELKAEGIDLTSVYRNLSSFVKIGLIHEVGEGFYKLCTHLGCGSHPHFLISCENCGLTEEPKSHDRAVLTHLEAIQKMARGFTETRLITLRGLCKQCSGPAAAAIRNQGV